jgi:integrase
MASKNRLTDKFIAVLKPKPQRYELWEGGGFGIRVSPGGGKTWVWVYHHEGRSRRMTLGSPPAVGLADARLKLAQARKLLHSGVDPGEREVQQHKAERKAETVEELAEEYLDKWARPRKRSAAEDERILRKDVISAWGKRKAKDIARRDVIALLDAIVDRGSPIAANRTLAVIRRMFNWALSRDIVGANPCVAVKSPAKENRRDRVLSTEEIAVLWQALDRPAPPRNRSKRDPAELEMSPAIRLALKLQLATAQRKGEVIAAEWSEFDLDERVWTIPAGRAKNGMPHRVPLSPLALAVLREIKGDTGPRPGPAAEGSARWLFPSPKPIVGPNGEPIARPVTDLAVNHSMHRSREALGICDATPHDLRRTAASHMTSIGISRLVVSKILNHAEPGVTAVYDRHSYDAEKRAALEAWGQRLEKITGANVLRLPRPTAPASAISGAGGSDAA